MPAVTLNRQVLAGLSSAVHVPRYDLGAVRPGVVHLGLGNFHRAHMARYTHDLMARRSDALRWGILGAGLLPGDRRMQEALAPQDGLYTLVERSGAAEEVTVIGALAGVIFAGDASAELLRAIDDPAIRIVSLTVTEHGYCLDRATKQLDADHPAIRHDLADPEAPRSAIGILVETYRRRRDAGLPAFTALTCDNIQHNGDVLRDAVLDLAERRDPALADWIRAEAAFPNTMVDRITPVTREAQAAELRARYGIEDRWPVFAESFRQWVIEDRFVAGRPEWEEVGAQFVADVAPYEFMKLRLLNGSHLAVAALGRLAGYHTIDQSMADPAIRALMVALMDRETGPTLPQVPGIDIALYKRTLVERFANTAIEDTVERVNTDAPVNVLVDPLRDRLRADGGIGLLALALAAWFRRIRGEDEEGRPIEIRHPLAATLRERAVAGGPDPAPLLAVRPLFGELGEDPRLRQAVGRWLASLYAVGCRETLRRARQEEGF
ncbi:mannitol dehydrogenase family protein [Dankookia rubra]|nr:mannitol dehydrogenase family protein [Dankookia rubra]